MPEPVVLVLLLAWAALTGLDLVSFPQALLSRPLVAGAGAGLILGDVATGLRVGLVLELFALDVLPVGAARYPDYGPATTAAVVAAGSGPALLTLGPVVLLALGLAVVGGFTLRAVRQQNGLAIRRAAAGLAAGDAATIAAVQRGGLGRDALRSLALAGLGLALALAVRDRIPPDPRLAWSSAAAIGSALAAAAAGAIRSAGRGARLRWLAAGAGAGLLAVVLK